jgi:GNAT superfamily N-acetyltransferase
VPASAPYSIAAVTVADLDELLDLMRAYCDFYATAPSDDALLAMSRSLLEEPDREGIQLLARDGDGMAVGFATVFWSWDTTAGSRIGIMNDLYIRPDARGAGLADRLIGACRERCAQRGASRLEWLTAPENARARAVYERARAVREPWLVYTLATTSAG